MPGDTITLDPAKLDPPKPVVSLDPTALDPPSFWNVVFPSGRPPTGPPINPGDPGSQRLPSVTEASQLIEATTSQIMRNPAWLTGTGVPGMEKLGPLPGAKLPVIPPTGLGANLPGTDLNTTLDLAEDEHAPPAPPPSALTGDRGMGGYDPGPFIRGGYQVAEGADRLTDAGEKGDFEPTASALAEMVGGAMDIASPAIAGALTKAPLRTIVTLAAGMGTAEEAEKELVKRGVSPGTARLASQMAGLAVGGAVAHGTGKVSDESITAHNERAAELIRGEGNRKTTGERIGEAVAGGEGISVTVNGKPGRITYAGINTSDGLSSGRPVYRLTDEGSGKTLVQGYAPELKTYIDKFEPKTHPADKIEDSELDDTVDPGETTNSNYYTGPKIKGKGTWRFPPEAKPPGPQLVKNVKNLKVEDLDETPAPRPTKNSPIPIFDVAEEEPPAPGPAVAAPRETTQQQTAVGKSLLSDDGKLFNVLVGDHADVKTARGTVVTTRYAVVPASQLITSHTVAGDENPDYPQELQPRDRSRKASQVQVDSIAQKLDPNELGASYKASDGAPIVGEDSIVESGNGRVNALKKLYGSNHENGLRYKQWLLENIPKFGLTNGSEEDPLTGRFSDASIIRNMPDPVLVRIRQTDVDRQQFAREANETGTASMSASEIANADAKQLSGELMKQFRPTEDGEIIHGGNADFVRGFMRDVVSPADRAAYMTGDGMISQAGVNRIRNAVFARAYGDHPILSTMAESTDSNVRNVTGGMLQAAPHFADLQESIDKGDSHPLQIAGDVAAAAQKISELRAKGQSVKDYLDQAGLFGRDLSPEASDILALLDAHKRSARQIGHILREYTRGVYSLGNPKQDSLFAGKTVPSKREVLESAYDRARKEFGDDDPTGRQGALPLGSAGWEPQSPAGSAGDHGESKPDEAAGQVQGPATPAAESRPAEPRPEAAREVEPPLAGLAKPGAIAPRQAGESPAVTLHPRDFEAAPPRLPSHGDSEPPLAGLAQPGPVAPRPGPPAAPAITAHPRDFEAAPPHLPNSAEPEKPERVNETAPADAKTKLLARVRTAIDHKEDIRLKLERMAEETYGGSRAGGAFTKQDLYEIQEAAVNSWLADNGKRLLAMPFEAAQTELDQVLSRLATQTVRSGEKIAKQQFSTPPNVAYLVDRLGDPRATDIVLEPSAGVGGLVAMLRDVVAGMHLNEIDPGRLDLAAQAIGKVGRSAVDGELLNSLLDASVKPTLVLMNPPFSAGTMKSNEARNDNKYGYNHLEQALQRVAPGGRVVAILGGGQQGGQHQSDGASLTAPTQTARWQQFAKRYNIRANVRIAGKEYAKYGTNYDVRVIVIDKDGPTPGGTWLDQLSHVVRGDYADVESAWKALTNVATTRPQGVDRAQGGLFERDAELPAGSQEAGVQHGARSGRSPGRVRGTGPGGSAARVPTPEPQDEPGNRAPSTSDGDRESAPAPPRSRTPERVKPRRRKRPPTPQEDSPGFVKYEPSIEGPEHPGHIVETKTMSTVPLPQLTYAPMLSPSLVESGKLSAAQLEAVVLAGQQNDTTLPSGARAAALVGDGTGLGKGRIAAAIALDNFNQGRKRVAWVSEKWDLAEDAKRDLRGIGAGDLAVDLKKMDAWKGDKQIEHEGPLFAPYSMLRSQDARGNRRIDQFEAWLKGSDEGDGAYVVWDEAHNLKNTTPGGRQAASQTGQRIAKLMKNLPKLRVVFLSATAASEVANMGYLDRLGLWGPQTAFPGGFTAFSTAIGADGLSAMELVAREMKAQGMYLARTLSFKGITYDEAEHQLNADQKAIYRDAAAAWREVTRYVQASVETVNGGAQARSNFMNQFWAAHQRFFNLLITALKTPTAIELAQEKLDEGKSVVISLVNTNESAQKRQENKQQSGEEDDDGLDFGPADILINLVRQHYPVQQWADDVDDSGKAIKVPVYTTDAQGNQVPVVNPQAVAERDGLIKHLKDTLRVPSNPLDILIDHFGAKNVAELTGRQKRFDSTTGKFVNRGDPGTARDKVNLTEMADFQSGKKRLAILSNAAGTGISLHSDLAAKNQQKRAHITLQPGWSADRAMQMFGRTHRTNQASPPEYYMVVSDLAGEKRFSSTIAKRLGSLGALTRGERSASGGSAAVAAQNYDSVEGRRAAVSFYQRLMNNQVLPGTETLGLEVLAQMGVLKEQSNGSVEVQGEDNVNRLLNRMLALDPETQNAAFDYYQNIFDAAVAQAIEDGSLDTGVKQLAGKRVTVQERQLLATDEHTGAETYHYPVDVETERDMVSPEKLEKLIEKANGKGRFWRNERSGRLIFASPARPITHADGRVEDAYLAYEPTNAQPAKIGADDLSRGTWRNLGMEAKAAKDAWAEQYAREPSTVTETHHLLGGAVLRHWGAMRPHMRGVKLAQDSGSGERVVGADIDPAEIQHLIQQISGGRSTVTPGQVATDVLQNGTEYQLEHGVRVKRGSVARKPVIQFLASDRQTLKRLEELGAVYEKGVVPMYYAPENKAHEVIRKVLGEYPVKVHQGERGSAPLELLTGGLSNLLKPSGPEQNYSAFGSWKDRWVRNLSQLEEADPAIHAAAVRMATSRAQAAVLIRGAVPKIEKALGDKLTWHDLYAAGIESRLRGIRERWYRVADAMGYATSRDLLDSFEDGSLPGLLDQIGGKRSIDEDVTQVASAFCDRGDWQGLREYLASTFRQCARDVAHVLDDESFDRVRARPGFQDGLRAYQELLEKALAESHAQNEGIFSRSLGPLQTYFPLIAMRDDENPAAKLRKPSPFVKPRNMQNEFATGMAWAYDLGMDALKTRLERAIKANNKASLIEALETAGFLYRLKPGETSGDTMMIGGRETAASTIEVKPARQRLKDGKTERVASVVAVVPAWLKKELQPILETAGMDQSLARRLIALVNGYSLAGPLDFAYHTANLLGALVANTPFLGDIASPQGIVGNLPFTKMATAMIQISLTDPISAEAIADLEDMSKLGLVPERYGSETYSSKFARDFGGKLRAVSLGPLKVPYSFGPLLYGPKGIDVRARLVMYRMAKRLNPDASKLELYRIVNQLGNYTASLQGQIERGLKASGFAPFFTAGSTMWRNGVNAMLGTGPTPGNKLGYRLLQMLTGGALGATALWVLAHKAQTGKWPWDDRNAKFMRIPLTAAQRNSWLGRALFGTKPGTAYVDLGWCTPLVERGARNLGLADAFETHQLHGSAGQQLEAAIRGQVNGLLHPVTTGPLVRAGTILATGDDPYVTSLHPPSLFPATKRTKPGLPLVTERGKEALLSLNSFAKNVAGAAGFGHRATETAKTGNRLLRMVTDVAVPRLVGPVSDNIRKAQRLRSERLRRVTRER